MDLGNPVESLILGLRLGWRDKLLKGYRLDYRVIVGLGMADINAQYQRDKFILIRQFKKDDKEVE